MRNEGLKLLRHGGGTGMRRIVISILSLMAVSVITQTAVGQAHLPLNMVAWWTLDEPTGTSLDDLASVHNVGTPNGPPASVAGMVGPALSFNGTTDHVSVADHNELDFGSGSFSIDAWVRTSTAGTLPIVDKRSGGAYPQGYMLFVQDGKLGLMMADGQVGPGNCNCNTPGAACETYVASGPDIRGTGWHHVTATVDRRAGATKTGVLYVDGVPVHSFTPLARSVTNAADLYIGRRHADNCAGSSYWTGEIDEVEMFCRALTPAEVQSIYDAESAGKEHCLQPPANMLDWWPFDFVFAQNHHDVAGAVDNVGSHMNGTPTIVPGMVDGALAFNGSEYVSVPDQAELDFGTGSFTIDAWIEAPAAATGIRSLVDKRTGGLLPQGYTLFLVNGQLGFQMADGVGTDCNCNTPGGCCDNYVSSGPNLLNSGWRHVAVVVDRTVPPGTGNLYVDGSSILTFTPRAGDLSNSAPLWIGRHHTNDCASISGYWLGRIDELEMFDRPLSQPEIFEIYAADSTGKCKPCCCCPSQEDFDGDGFVTVIDLSVLVDILFAGANNIQDSDCPVARGDDDLDGFTTVLDLTYKIDYLFNSGPPPPDPCEPQWIP